MSSGPLDARTAPTLGTLLALAWPLVVSRSSQVVINLSDVLMVSYLGKTAMAATTQGAFNAFAVFILPMGTVFIVSSFSSQLFGKGDLSGARRYAFYGLGVAAATEVICAASLPFVPAVLAQLPLDPDVQALMANYLFWRLLSGGAAVGIEALGNYYGGLGNTRLPMRINVLAMVLNVALNWLLIGGNLGAPRMGVAGAALASSLATWIAFAVVLTRFLRDGRAAGVVLPRLHGHEMLRLLRFGFPAGCNWFFEFMAFNFFLNVVVGKLGSNAVAAMNTVIHINSASFMPAFGVASAGAILVGQAIGAGARDDVPRILRLTFLTTGTWQGLVGLLYLAAPGLLLLAFSELMPESEAPAFTEVGVRMLMLSAAWQLFDAAVATLAEALRAAGDTTFTLWARTVVGWLIFAPGSYYCVYHLGMSEAAAASWVVFYLGLLAAVLYARFLTGAWRRIELTEPAAA